MATPTLDAYRQLNPQDTRADSELVPELIARLHNEGTLAQYPDLVDYAGKMDREYRNLHRPNPAKEFVRSAIGGVDLAQGIGYSALAQAGDAFGLDSVKNFGIKGYLQNQREAQQNQPTVPSIEDVHGVGDALYYGLGVAGQQAPQLAATMGTTAAGAGLGFLAGGPPGAGVGAMIGGAAAGYVQGQNYADLATSGGADPLLTSASVGVLSGVLEMLVPIKIVRTAFGAEARAVSKMGVEELLKRVARTNPSLVKAIAKEAAEDSAGEAITEAAQELVTIAGEMYSHRNDPNFHISDEEITSRVLNSGVAGGILGLPAGAFAGPGHRAHEVHGQEEAQARLDAINARKAETLAQFTSQPPESTIPSHVIETPVDQYIQQNTDPRYGMYRGMFDQTQVANDQARQDSENPQAAALLRAKLAQEAQPMPQENPEDLRLGEAPPAGPAATAPLPPTQPTGQPEAVTPVDIGARDATVSTGTGVPTMTEQQMMDEWKKQIAEQTKQPEVLQATEPAPTAVPPSSSASRTVINWTNSSRFINKGTTDSGAFADFVAQEVDTAIKSGKEVVFATDSGRKEVPIVGVNRGMMVDAKGQRWGTLSILTDRKDHVIIKNRATPALSKTTESPATAQPSAPASESGEVQYTVFQSQSHPEDSSRLIPGYVQIERKTNQGRGEPISDAERASFPKPPEWMPSGQYTLQQVQDAVAKDKEAANAVSEPQQKPSAEGDIPLDPLLVHRNAVQNIFPPLRKESTPIPPQSTGEALSKLAKKGIRKDEHTKGTTKRLIAVKEKATGQILMWPVYVSTGDEARVDNGVEAKVSSQDALAKALGGEDEAEVRAIKRAFVRGGADRAPLDKVWSELKAGTKADQTVAELATDARYTPIAFFDAVDPIEKKHFVYDNEEKFLDESKYTAEQQIVTKGSTIGGEGVPQILERLTALSPRDARAVQVLAGILEQTTEAKALGASKPSNPALKYEPEKIVKRLVSAGRTEAFAENLAKAKNASELLREGKNGLIFGLFNPEQWEGFKKLIERSRVDVPEIHAFIDKAIADAKWTSKTAFIASVVPQAGTKSTGEQLLETDEPTHDEIPDSEGNVDNPAAQAHEAGALRDFEQKNQTGVTENLEATTGGETAPVTGDGVPEKAKAATDFSSITALEKVKMFLASPPAELATEVRNVLDARADSEISNPAEDLEFQAVKDDLSKILEESYKAIGKTIPPVTEDFLYGLYANLDRLQRDSQPGRATYRETSDTVQRIFHATVAWLGDKGVDVRLIESNFGSQVEFLRNEWGRALKAEDGKRIIILSMADLTEPTRDNLRTLFHEVVHHMFFDEPVWVQKLMHESVERLTQLQMDVFSKTYDDRIKNQRLPATELLEEVLAEHLSFFGIEQTVARSLGQRLIDGIRKAFSRAALFYSELRGVIINPQWAQTYMELRFRDMLDKVITSANDFDTLTGNARQTAKFQGTFYRQSDGGLDVERWDTASGQFIVNDVVDESVLASQFNLDNNLVFSDVVVRDSRAQQRVQEWTDRFGVTFEPTPIIDVLRRVETDPDVPDGLGKLTTALLTSNHHNLNKTKISFIKEAYGNPSFKGFKDTPAVYSNGKNEILIDASVVGGLTNTDAEYVILHEVAHAVTSQSTSVYRMWKTVDGTAREKIEGAALVADGPAPNSAGHESYLKRLRGSMEIIAKAERIFNFLKTKKWLSDYEYGMTHFDEFLAESLTNRVFQKYLSSIQLPPELRVTPKNKSIFRQLIELFNRLFTGKEGNALDSTLAATEDIIMVAGTAIQRGFGAMSFAAPVTEQESNDKVKKNFEYELAALNTQADFYHAVFDKAAGTPENFDKYLTQTLGIPNPERAIQEHQKQVAARPELKVNDKMRLSDAAGVANRVQATMDRDQITKRLVASVSTAAGKLSAKMAELKDQIPKHEKELERAENRFINFDAKLHDITTIRDNALKILRRGLRGAERNATRLAQWAARHDGLQGVAADLFNVASEEDLDPDDADLVLEAMEDHSDDFFVTDALTAAVENNIEFDALAPHQIERQIQDVYKTTKDARLAEVADGSPKAKAELALLIYYAKTAPEDMMALSVRVEKDPERKEQILAMIKKIIRGNVDAAEGLNDLFKDVRSGDVKVGKAKSSLSEAVRQLKQANKNLSVASERAVEMEKAAGALNKAVKKYQAEVGFRGKPFEPYDGAPILLTPGNDLTPGILKLGPTSGASVNKIMMENIKWLNAHNEQDPDWHAIKSQAEGLKKVAGNQVFNSFRNSKLSRAIGSFPERLNNLGIPLLRLAGNRWHRFYANRQETEPITTRGYEVSEAYDKAMKATGFNKSYQGFKDTFWNPANHFLRHLTLLRGSTTDENRQYAKEQLKMFFARNNVTRDAISKPDAFETVWNALQVNAEVSSAAAKWAAKHNVLVEDEDVKIVNPRTGKVETGLRPAMDVGLFTTQSNIEKIFGKKHQLDNIKDGNGDSMWAQWAQNNTWKKWASEEERAALSQLFTPEVIFHFVQPYIFDTGTLHFDAPFLADGVTRNKAKPLSVQTAWDTADGDVLKFANNLFDMEYTLRNEPSDHNANREQFVNDTVDFFRRQYKKIHDLAKKQEQFNIRGMRTDSFLASPMMNNIKAGDFPPEFMDYYIYDHDSLRVMFDHLAAHAAFGRDLGLFSGKDEPNGGYFWELETAKVDLEKRKAEWTAVTSEIRRANPRAGVKEIEAEAKKQLGDAKFTSLKNIQLQERELTAIENETISFFNSARGNTRDMTLPQSIIGGLAGAMVNNFKSAINQVSQAFEPFMVYGVGKVGMQQAFRTLAASSRSAAGSLVQGVSGQALLASEYARFMNENGIGRDPANFITSSQITSDPGKNNIYEDKRLLGMVRKGRALAFDTGFRGAEGERIAPKFRPQAPFSIASISLNQGGIEAEIRLYNDLLKQAMQVMSETPGALNDPAYEFSGKDMKIGGNTFDDLAWEELKNEFKTMGTSLEIETRELLANKNGGKPLGNIVVNPDLARLIAGRAMQRFSLPNDISSSASWMSTSPLGRIAMPLISWSLNKTNQLVGAFREPNGEASRRAMVAGIAALAVGMVPAAILISLLTDQYDERVLSKKSNLVGFNFDSPSQTAIALMERVGRIGTFGMAGDLVNGVRVYGTSGDLRGVSVDQRVVFVNTLMSFLGLLSTAYNQEGTLTYDTFYRPLLNTMGGSGILQNQQILNNITNSVMGVPVFRAESETTARLNALNYLRGAGRVLELDVRTGSGMKSLPNPTKPWVNEMVVAAYSNNRSEFIEAYQRAVASAREEGKQDPEDYVKSSFRAYHPLRYVFTTAPSKYEVGQIMSTLSDKGQEDVSQALQYFNAYGQSIGIKPYEGREVSSNKEPGTKKAPSPWGKADKKNPWK